MHTSIYSIFTQSFSSFGIYTKEEKGFQYTTISPIFDYPRNDPQNAVISHNFIPYFIPYIDHILYTIYLPTFNGTIAYNGTITLQ